MGDYEINWVSIYVPRERARRVQNTILLLGIGRHELVELLFVEPEVMSEHVVLRQLRVDQFLVNVGGISSQFPFPFQRQTDREIVRI